MAMPIKRIIVPRQGDDDNFKLALAVASHLCDEFTVDRVTMVIAQKRFFDTNTIGKLLASSMKTLTSGGSISIPTNRRLFAETVAEAKKKRTSIEGIVLAVHLDLKNMEVVDELPNVQGIVFLPWTPGESEAWRTTWNATVVGAPATQDEAKLDARIVEELTTLTSTTDGTNHLAHALDREKAQKALDSIKEKGIAYDPDELRRWLLRNKWRSEDVVELLAMLKP